MSNQTDVKSALAGAVATDRGGEATINALTDIFVTYTKGTADSMAADATAAVLIGFTNPFDFSLQVVGAKIVSASALTAHADNYANVNILTDNGANSTPAAAAVFATSVAGTGSWATDVAKSAAITAANATLVAGGNLHFSITKAGSGVVVPVSYITVRLRKI